MIRWWFESFCMFISREQMTILTYFDQLIIWVETFKYPGWKMLPLYPCCEISGAIWQPPCFGSNTTRHFRLAPNVTTKAESMGVVGEQDQIQSAGSFKRDHWCRWAPHLHGTGTVRYIYLHLYIWLIFMVNFVGKYTYQSHGSYGQWDHLWLVTLVRDHLKRNLGLKAVTSQPVGDWNHWNMIRRWKRKLDRFQFWYGSVQIIQ